MIILNQYRSKKNTRSRQRIKKETQKCYTTLQPVNYEIGSPNSAFYYCSKCGYISTEKRSYCCNCGRKVLKKEKNRKQCVDKVLI